MQSWHIVRPRTPSSESGRFRLQPGAVCDVVAFAEDITDLVLPTNYLLSIQSYNKSISIDSNQTSPLHIIAITTHHRNRHNLIDGHLSVREKHPHTITSFSHTRVHRRPCFISPIQYPNHSQHSQVICAYALSRRACSHAYTPNTHV